MLTIFALDKEWSKLPESLVMNFRNSRKVNMAELSSANLIITLDEETEKFVKSRTFYINGQVRPIAMFLQADAHPYIPDPFAREFLIHRNYEQYSLRGV